VDQNGMFCFLHCHFGELLTIALWIYPQSSALLYIYCPHILEYVFLLTEGRTFISGENLITSLLALSVYMTLSPMIKVSKSKRRNSTNPSHVLTKKNNLQMPNLFIESADSTHTLH